MPYTFTVHCTHRQWIGKPDPRGFDKFTYSTNDLAGWRERCLKTGTRIAVILEGHHEIKLESAMVDKGSQNGVSCSMTRYASFDSRYDSDFARWLDASKLTVARDFRGHNPHTGEISAEQGE